MFLPMNSDGPAACCKAMISVVIPAFNEEANIPAVFEAVRSSLLGLEVCEIIFVDDGSLDATAERIRSLRERHSLVRLIGFAVTSANRLHSWQDWKQLGEQP